MGSVTAAKRTVTTNPRSFVCRNAQFDHGTKRTRNILDDGQPQSGAFAVRSQPIKMFKNE